MADRLKPGSKAAIARDSRWRHNGYKGCVRMMERQLQAMVQSPSCTMTAKAYASQILSQLKFLKAALDDRIDP